MMTFRSPSSEWALVDSTPARFDAVAGVVSFRAELGLDDKEASIRAQQYGSFES